MKTYFVKPSLVLPGRFWSDWVEAAYGILLAAAIYLFLCSGKSLIPWQIARYFLYTGSFGLLLSTMSVTHDKKWSLKSLILFIPLLPAYVLFGLGSQIKLPGTEFIAKELAAISLFF